MFSASLLFHEIVMYRLINVSGSMYYITAIFVSGTLAAVLLNRCMDRLSVSLIYICAIAIICNVFGLGLYLDYMPPGMYDLSIIALNVYTLYVILRPNADDNYTRRHAVHRRDNIRANNYGANYHFSGKETGRR